MCKASAQGRSWGGGKRREKTSVSCRGEGSGATSPASDHLLHLLMPPTHWGGPSVPLGAPCPRVCLTISAFSEGSFERGPQGQGGQEALDAEAVGPSQLKEHVGLNLGECVLRRVHTLKAPLSVNGTICSDLWNIPQLLFNVGRIISGISM